MFQKIKLNTLSEIRTRTFSNERRILSALCLPFHHEGSVTLGTLNASLLKGMPLARSAAATLRLVEQR